MMTIKISKTIITGVAVAIIMAACNAGNNAVADSKKNADSTTVAVYTFQVENGYGYAVFINGREFINQNCIPVIQGNRPFASRQQAAQTGELVAQKIKEQQLPSLTLEELNTLGITQQ